VTATPLKDMVRIVNGRINSRVTYATDMELYGVEEFWTQATSQGDCEDYAIAKAVMLLDEGFPHEDMRIATGWTEDHVYHAVLLVRVEDGDWVMDNRHKQIVRLEETGYQLDKIQVPGTNLWEYAKGSPGLDSQR
jgi:predicted transglutaminase-like cysteine proteinase